MACSYLDFERSTLLSILLLLRAIEAVSLLMNSTHLSPQVLSFTASSSLISSPFLSSYIYCLVHINRTLSTNAQSFLFFTSLSLAHVISIPTDSTYSYLCTYVATSSQLDSNPFKLPLHAHIKHEYGVKKNNSILIHNEPMIPENSHRISLRPTVWQKYDMHLASHCINTNG